MMVNERRTEAVAFAFIAWRRPYQFCPLLRMQGLEEVPPPSCPAPRSPQGFACVRKWKLKCDDRRFWQCLAAFVPLPFRNFHATP